MTEKNSYYLIEVEHAGKFKPEVFFKSVKSYVEVSEEAFAMLSGKNTGVNLFCATCKKNTQHSTDLKCMVCGNKQQVNSNLSHTNQLQR